MISTTHKQPRLRTSPKKFRVVALILALMFVALIPWSPVRADRFDDEIAALKADIAAKQAVAAELAAQADTLANKVAGLQAQIGALQSLIAANELKQQQLADQIAAAEKKLTEQKANLAQSIRQIYLEGDVTTVEMLASSNSISEFVDKQQYLDTLKTKISDTVTEITLLKKTLEDSKKEIDLLIIDQNAQKTQLAAQQAETDRLLADTQGQEAAYQSQIANNNSQIKSLRAAQAAENARRLQALTGSASGSNATGLVMGGGGYPGVWAFAPIDSLVDNWGMYNRECVSYTAWKVASTGRYMPYWGGRGNAKQWPDNAIAAGIPTDNNPRVGDVAIWGWRNPSDPYGHAMYVEQVYGNGWIRVSQYNFNWAGMYNEMDIPANSAIFIHF